MRISIDNVKLTPRFSEKDIIREIALIGDISDKEIKETKVLHKSLDARKKDNIIYVLRVSFEVGAPIAEKLLANPRFKVEIERKYEIFTEIANHSNGASSENLRPIIVGSGPAGIFCALILAEYGLKPIIIEQGEEVSKRALSVSTFFSGGALNTSSNVQFGEGGAGAFSDGKLNTGIGGELCYYVLDRFVHFGAPENILYDAKPHIGTDILIKVVANMRSYIEKLGGEYRFCTKMTDIIINNDICRGVICENLGEKYELISDITALAIGHSSRDSFEMLQRRGVAMEAKAFAVGLRAEHLQKDIDQAQYGAPRDKLGLSPADYKLAVNLANGRGVYSFCMCPGGYVVASSSEDGCVAVNGMSYNSRGGVNANSAIVCTVKPEDFGGGILGGIEFQRSLERSAYNVSGSYRAPCQRLSDFLRGKETVDFGKVEPSYKPSVVKSDINKILPKFITSSIKEAFGLFANKVRGFADGDTLLTAVESRTSSPVRILRDEQGMASVSGLYPIGEGAGYSGGITSSAVDGIKAAIKILSK